MKRFFNYVLAAVILTLPAVGNLLGGEPLPVSEAVQKALSYSPYINAMISGEKAAREKVGEARAMKGPHVSVGATASRLDSPMMAFGTKLNQGRIAQSDFSPGQLNDPSGIDSIQMGVQIGVPLSLGGMDRHAVGAARKGVEAASFDTVHAREQVIFRTIETYLNVILARESLVVAEKACEASRETVRNAEGVFEAERAVESDLLQAKVHHSQNEETFLRMKNQLKLALEGLATIMGIPTAEGFELTMPFLQQECTLCGEEPRALLDLALAKRPDFLKMSRQIEALGHSERMHRGAVRPHFMLGVAAENNRERFGKNGHDNSMVFARLDWKLADGGEAGHKAAGVRFQEEQMNRMQVALADQIFLEIREAVTNINNSLERIRVSREAIRQGSESLRILRDRYSAGLAIMSDLLGAETSLLSHQMNHLKALYDYSIGKARLKMAVGELDPEHCEILSTSAAVAPDSLPSSVSTESNGQK